MLAAFDAKKHKEETEQQEIYERETKEALDLEKEQLVMAPFVKMARSISTSLHERVCTNIKVKVGKTHPSTGINKCVIGGSHTPFRISEARAELADDHNDTHGLLMGVEVVPLLSNDVDVFHGEFTRDPMKCLEVNMSKIKKFAVEEVSRKVNTVECDNLNPSTFLANNDVNIMASCFLVEFSSGECVVKIRASSCFWTFMFQDHYDRKIQPVYTINIEGYEGTTCIRISFNEFEMDDYLLQTLTQ